MNKKIEEYECECGKTHKKIFRKKESKVFKDHWDKRIRTETKIVGISLNGSLHKIKTKPEKSENGNKKMMLLSDVDDILCELKEHNIKILLDTMVTDGDWLMNWRLERRRRYDGSGELIEKSFTPIEKYKYDRIIAISQGKKLGFFKRMSNRRILKKLLS